MFWYGFSLTILLSVISKNIKSRSKLVTLISLGWGCRWCKRGVQIHSEGPVTWLFLARKYKSGEVKVINFHLVVTVHRNNDISGNQKNKPLKSFARREVKLSQLRAGDFCSIFFFLIFKF